MEALHLGIDTGGTYTDAVILNPQSGETLAAAKSLTTKGDLSIGVINALSQVLEQASEVNGHDIALVALSTTLATNALVEGKGSKVAVVLIGFDDDMVMRTDIPKAMSDTHIIRINGGHDYAGNPVADFDKQALITALEDLGDSVEAFAVAGVYSVRNASHELAAKALIREHTGKPITASHELSDGLNGPRRALTAGFNARIIAMIVALIEAVRAVMVDKNIVAPLMVVKGDGSIANADIIAEKPIETILSGPAASVIGATHLSGLQDFIISDIGGTTTDVAIVRHGWPDLNEAGAMIGTHRTMVRAIDMQTIGLGGDSAIEIDHTGKLSLLPDRVVPASLIGHKWPSVQHNLERFMAQGMGLGKATLFLLRPEGSASQIIPTDLPPTEKELLELVTEEPVPWTEVVQSVSDRSKVRRLIERGLLQVAGLTPSDAAHVLDKQSQWSRSVAELVCLMIGRSHGKLSYDDKERDEQARKLAQEIDAAMVEKSTHILLERLCGNRFNVDDPIVASITRGQAQVGEVTVSLTPNIPVVAVGGPAPVFYPEVGRRLGQEVVIPPNSHVANAVGAAMGKIREQVVLSITAGSNGAYRVHGAGEPSTWGTPTEALSAAEKQAQELAKTKVANAGGHHITDDIRVEKIEIPGMENDKGLISAKVIVVAQGLPNE